jgi:hypothetical protein
MPRCLRRLRNISLRIISLRIISLRIISLRITRLRTISNLCIHSKEAAQAAKNRPHNPTTGMRPVFSVNLEKQIRAIWIKTYSKLIS